MTPPTVQFIPAPASVGGWRNEAPYLIEAEITSSWVVADAGSLIGDDNDVDNYTATYRGSLRPFHDTLAYQSRVVSPDGAWMCFGYFTNYTLFAIDWTTHPDATSGSNQTAFGEFESANPNWDLVIEVEDSGGSIIMRRVRSLSAISDPDWGNNFGAHFYWNNSPRVLAADYGVGVIVRLYFFDDTPTSLDFPPTEIS